MKPVFKCDYCNFMGTEEEVKEHELTCTDNYNRKSCYTCRHRTTNVVNKGIKFNCDKEIDIPEGKMFEFCKSYERKDKSNDSMIADFADMLFGNNSFGR